MSDVKLAPIIIFAYNRLTCLKDTVEALKCNHYASESILYIYSDGYKDSMSKKPVNDVRRYIRNINGFKEVHIIERSHNYGLACNIINGVTEIINKHNSVIVLEDDLITGKYFLNYMNDGLNMYENNSDVISIHGYSYFDNKSHDETYFIKTADNLGWATWKRGWDLFECDAKNLYSKIIENKLKKSFDRNNAYRFTSMLKMQAEGNLNSWAIRWCASCFLHGKYTLYPCKSLVLHIGDGVDATNYKRKQTASDPLSVSLYQGKVDVSHISVSESKSTTRQYRKFLKKYRKPIIIRIINKIFFLNL